METFIVAYLLTGVLYVLLTHIYDPDFKYIVHAEKWHWAFYVSCSIIALIWPLSFLIRYAFSKWLWYTIMHKLGFRNNKDFE